MKIRQLSAAELSPAARILPETPDTAAMPCTVRREFSAQDAAEQFWSEEPVVVDYVSGMPMIVFFEGEARQAYYLDRVLQIAPNVHFCLAALSGTCTVELHLRHEAALKTAPGIPARMLQAQPSALKFTRLYTFFYQECAGDFYFRGEQHEAYELVYVDRGVLHNLVGGRDIVLAQRQILLIGQEEWHTQYSDQPVSFLTLSFLAQSEALRTLTDRAISLTGRAITLLQWMLAEHSEGTFGYDCAESLLRLLLVELLRGAQKQAAVPDTQLPATRYAEQQIVERLMRTVLEASRHRLTLRQLADSAHISVAYMHRLFQTQLGMSPGAYIAKIRMEESKLLLRDGTMSMGEVAKKMGFSSQQQFSRQFRTVTGMTPTEYVRSLR